MLVGDYERELKRLRESADRDYERIRNLTSGEVGYRSPRVERAFVRTIVDVRGTKGIAEMLSVADEGYEALVFDY